jgi:hypothetical protein
LEEDEGGLLEIPSEPEPQVPQEVSSPEPAPSEVSPEVQADEPIALPPIEMDSESAKTEPVPAKPPGDEVAAESAPTPEVAADLEATAEPTPMPEVAVTPEVAVEPAAAVEVAATPEVAVEPAVAAEAKPAPEVAAEPAPTPTPEAAPMPESSPTTEPAPTPEVAGGGKQENPKPSESAEVTAIRVAVPHPAAMTEPPPFVPGARVDVSSLPHPPLPSRSMIAVTAAPVADPAMTRIGTVVTEADAQRPVARPARRSLWDRFRREIPEQAPSAGESTRISAVPFHSVGVAGTSPLFPATYYSQGVEAKRDDQAQQVSVPPEAPPEKPRRFRLFHRFFDE